MMNFRILGYKFKTLKRFESAWFDYFSLQMQFWIFHMKSFEFPCCQDKVYLTGIAYTRIHIDAILNIHIKKFKFFLLNILGGLEIFTFDIFWIQVMVEDRSLQQTMAARQSRKMLRDMTRGLWDFMALLDLNEAEVDPIVDHMIQFVEFAQSNPQLIYDTSTSNQSTVSQNL